MTQMKLSPPGPPGFHVEAVSFFSEQKWCLLTKGDYGFYQAGREMSLGGGES